MTGPLLVAFGVLTAATFVFAMLRLAVVRVKTDEAVHLSDYEAPLIDKQRTQARRLKIIDRCGQALTVLAFATGVATYAAWLLGA